MTHMRHSNFLNELFSAPLNGYVTEGAHFLPCYFHQKGTCFANFALISPFWGLFLSVFNMAKGPSS
jgi:hypothetical protein